jgi:hypothetical protein
MILRMFIPIFGYEYTIYILYILYLFIYLLYIIYLYVKKKKCMHING